MPTWTLFFHLFNVQLRSAELTQSQDLVSLKYGKKMFEVYSNSLKNFKERYYLVTHLRVVSHMIMYDVQFDAPSKFSDRFLKLWCQNNFLSGVETNVYLPVNLSHEETYLKNKVVVYRKT